MGKGRKSSLNPHGVTGDDNIVYIHSESTQFLRCGMSKGDILNSEQSCK